MSKTKKKGNKTESNDRPFEFAIKAIKTLLFSINEDVVPSNLNDVSIGFGLDLNFDVSSNEIVMAVSVKFSRKSDKSPLINSKVQTTYLVKDLAQYAIADDALDINRSFMDTMFGISLSHLRASLAHLNNGTVHNALIVPIVQPGKLLADLIGEEKLAE